MTDLRVVLLQGGQSSERAISLSSGAAVHQALVELGHEVQVVDGFQGLQRVNKTTTDVVFNMLHGADGEDGKLAAWLHLEGFQSTCCSFAGASVTWHKDQAKAIVAQAGIKTPKSQLLTAVSQLRVDDSGPWIVKPATEGSSVGLFKANDKSELMAALNAGFAVADALLVETFIDGTESTVGVVGGEVLPVVSIKPANELYDYAAKYQSTQTQYHCPADFSVEWQQAVQNDAKVAYEALGIDGWCRLDFIIDDSGQAWFLEANTTPGMTNSSLLPKAAAVHGWSFNELVAQILRTAVPKTTTGAADE